MGAPPGEPAVDISPRNWTDDDEAVNVTNTAAAANWLRNELGKACLPLSGLRTI